ncbi:phage head spike fiber domain-containing protein [Aeromonas veronii]|uniref:phage head spike fiber domain-containing protein n=1 Tax=Aeromonas veronii TaxID=654 RepID=UPI003B9FAAD6
MAGVWKRDGTVAVTNGSKKVTGTGTTFADAKNGVAKGHLFCMTTGTTVDLYEVDYVVSNTELHLVQAFRGTTGTGKAYEIITTFSDSIPEFARKLNASLSYYQSQSDMVQQLFTSDAAEITVTAPDGTTHKLIPWKRVTSEGEGQAARAKVEADRSRDEANRAKDEADKAAGIVALAALPMPDVWAPLSDSLRMITGYGRDVLVGSDVVARMVNFSRNTAAAYVGKDGQWKTASANEPRFEKEGLLPEGQSANVFNKASGTNFDWISGGLTQSAGDAQLPFTVFQKKITSSTSTPTNTSRLMADIYSMPNPAASSGGQVTISAIMFGDAEAIIAAAPRFNISSNRPITGVTNSTEKLTSGMVRVVWTGVIEAGSSATFSNCPISWLDRLPSFVAGCYQIEALPFASSYIPTNGAAVTRAADLLSLPQAGNFQDSDFTVAIEVKRNTTIPHSVYPKLLQFGPDLWVVASSERVSAKISADNEYCSVIKPAPGSYETIVLRQKGGEMSLLVTGVAINKVSRTGRKSTLSPVIGLGSTGSGLDALFGNIRNLRVWHRALSDEQMRAIK